VAADCPIEQAGRSAYGPNGPGRGSDGPTVFRGTDLPSRDGGGCILPEYEFIDIPYKGWGYKSPFVADASDINTLLLVSYDGKLEATDFSNVRVNFLIDSSNPANLLFHLILPLIHIIFNRLNTIGFTYVGDLEQR
jgi:hypothetical protein